MKTIRLIRAIPWIPVAGLMMTLLVSATDQDDPRKLAMRAFMRQKLVYSQGVMEGLALEKFDLISKNALLMKNMTQTNIWLSVKQADYMQHTQKFQRNLDALFSAANDKNLDASTRAYLSVTRDCVACHRHLRLEQRKVVPNQLFNR